MTQAFNLSQLANNVNTSGQLTASAVNGTVSSSVTSTTATAIANVGGWAVTPTGTKLFFSYNGVNKGSLDSSGNFIVIGNVTAYGTP